MGTWVFLTIFFGIILVLVIVAVVGSKKDKSEKLIKHHKERTLTKEANKQRVEIYKELNSIVDGLEKEMEEFKPSIGTKSLGEINNEYSQRVKDIQNSKELISVYLREDYKSEMKEMMTGLVKNKPSNWNINPASQFSIRLVKAKHKSIHSQGHKKSK